MNIYNIAKQSGVSIATVSRVVHGSDKVSDKTKEKVLSAIEKSGYTPNVFAQGLGLNTMHTIGIMIPDISDAYMSKAVACLESRLNKEGYDCLLACSGYKTPEKEARMNMLLSKKIDAVILVGSTYAGHGKSEDTEYIVNAAKTTPIFMINAVIMGENIYSVINDDRKAVKNVVTNLINDGHKKILFMTDSTSYSAREKYAGYKEALTEARIPVNEDMKLKVKNRIHIAREELLSYEGENYDAVVASDDAMAVGAVKYAAERGLRIPADIEITGYNNSTLSVACEPELTSIDNRIADVCEATVGNLISLIRDGVTPERKTLIECGIVKRRTTSF